MSIVYLDTETTGLDPMKHDIWELAYAVDDGPIISAFLPMERFHNASIEALMVGNFHKRFIAPQDNWAVVDFDNELRAALNGNTLCGANPAFDAAFLRYSWWETAAVVPWAYRLFDIEAYAMGALGYDVPRGLNAIAGDLRTKFGADIPEPDHTATGDVATLRGCHLALKSVYDAPLGWIQGAGE